MAAVAGQAAAAEGSGLWDLTRVQLHTEIWDNVVLETGDGWILRFPRDEEVDFEHEALSDGDVVRLGNTEVEALSTPGHAAAHHAYLITDHVVSDDPWMVLTGDALLVGDAGRPDLHANAEQTSEEMAATLYRSLTEKLLALPDHVLLYPGHYSGSVCGRGLSANPASTIGFERRHNPALQHDSEAKFVAALTDDIPPAPEQQAEIIAANRSGRPLVSS